MKLYHFCAPQFLAGIQREGLTLGMTPILKSEGIALLPNTQWLTVNGSFEQAWNGMVNVKYDRTAFRIRVSIPESRRGSLLTVRQFAEIIGEEHLLPDFANPEFCDSENWRIFVGKIPAHWLREVMAKNETLVTV